VAVIYQELQLVSDMTVAENLYLGHLPNKAGWVDGRELLKGSLELLEMLGEKISPKAKLGSLSIGQRQMVEIAKALSRDAKIIAFDEPTSSLSAREIDRLFKVIAELRARGKVILYVTHRLEEVFQVCDCATVLRDGRHVETLPTLEGVTRDRLVSLMVGRSIEDVFGYVPREAVGTALSVNGITGAGLAAPASFAVGKGEILGFFGLVGSGRTELMKMVFGASPRNTGTVRLGDAALTRNTPVGSIRRGLMFCPEDRKKEGIVAIRSVMENLNLSGRRHLLRLGFFINERKERANAQKYVDLLDIKTPSLRQTVENLSGGNQQKVILARWLCEKVKAIILDEPTRGIDVGAKAEIYSIIYTLANAGIGVVVVSSELPEVLGICDRIMVMCEGRITANLPRADATQEIIMQAALPAVAQDTVSA
jgi:L-arabinose transport system ATP-binding protein